VQDEFASLWMRRFYTALVTDTRSPRDAVRKAELGMLREFRSERRTTHPYYWGAFVATGR
jgi:CHAT domain-containing protein